MAAKTLYLHVGMDKTGTSAIQNFIYHNKDRIRKDIDLCYPSTGIWSDFSHHFFAFSALEQHGHSIGDLSELFLTLIRESGESKNVLLSSECFFKIPIKEGFDALRKQIANHFNAVKVIIYVRRQDEWVESRHKHSIISGNELSLDMLTRPFFCNYKQYIDHWKDAYGKENIIVRAYEKQQFIGGNIYSDFMSIFDLELTNDYEVSMAAKNVSLGRSELGLKNLFNKIEFSEKYVDALNEILIEYSNASSSKRHQKKYYLSPLERTELINKYEKINAEIVDDYFERNDGKLFYEDIPNAELDWEKYSGISVSKMTDIGRFIYKKNRTLFLVIKAEVRKAIKADDVSILESGKALKHLISWD